MSTSSVDVMGSNPSTAWIFWTLNYCKQIPMKEKLNMLLKPENNFSIRPLFWQCNRFIGRQNMDISFNAGSIFSHYFVFTHSHSLTQTHAHMRSHPHTVTHAHTLICAPTLTHMLTNTRTHSFFQPHTLAFFDLELWCPDQLTMTGLVQQTLTALYFWPYTKIIYS